MANRQTYIVGALGVLAGMVVGANSAQRADMTVSYSGYNTDVAREMSVQRRGPILRSRSDENHRNYEVAPRAARFGEGVIGNIRDVRLGQTRMFGSAPTLRGSSAPRHRMLIECYGLSGKRYVNCEAAELNDERYDVNYYKY